MRTMAEVETRFSKVDFLEGVTSFFFAGIGGVGMASLAALLKREGYTVRGTDASETPMMETLRALGVEISTDLNPSDRDALVVTDAIDLDSTPGVVGHGGLLYRRSQVLGWALRNHDVIGVTGSHGKSSTTAMIGAVLQHAGLDPLVLIGVEQSPETLNMNLGRGKWAVVEACEAYDALRDLSPKIAVLTNLEPDHLDYHGSYAHLQEAVGRFLARAERVLVSARQPAAAAFANIRTNSTMAEVDSPVEYEPYSGPIGVIGDHQRENAGAAVAVAESIGIPFVEALASFRGIPRRLEVVRSQDPVVIDDYAHHPTEIRASIAAVRQTYPGRRVVAVFQPHLYSRTRDFLGEFTAELNEADFAVLTDIYPAREDPIPGISAARIAEGLTVPHRYVPSRHRLALDLPAWVEPTDVVLIMGAGNIADCVPGILAGLDRGETKDVWVVLGGQSAEREVSLHSGRSMAAALRRKGYNVREVDVVDLLLSGRKKLPPRPDAAVLAVHGVKDEDGATQGLFEILGIPYSGSGVQASAIAMDKGLTKQILGARGLPVPQGWLVRPGEPLPDLGPLTRVVVKPNEQGSTIGLTFVEDVAQLPAAVEKALAYDSACLIEEWLVGMEISVPVLGDLALPAVEIAPKSGQYDFANKYIPGATEEICPARLSPEVLAQVGELALSAHRALGCAGATRTDMIVTDRGPVILETNTLPGMTVTSLLPKSAETAGIPYDDLCVWILEDAIRRHGANR